MNRKFYTIAAACLLVGNMSAVAEETVNLGYCSGEVAKSGALAVEGKRWVSGAIYLPQSMLEPYSGAKICAVRAGLAGKTNVDSLRVWVREELNGENLSENIITQKSENKIIRGWNEVALPENVVIGDAGLYVGYSYHQKGEAGAFSAVGAGLENSFYGQLSPSEEWQDLSSYGILSVEAVVAGASRPEYDLGIVDARASKSVDGESYDVSVTLTNNGEKPVTGFTLEASYEVEGGSKHEFTLTSGMAPGEKSVVVISVPAEEEPEITDPDMKVSLKGIADGEDAVAQNNSLRVRFAFTKRVLVEEYTTEHCGNCPRVAGYLHEVMEMDKYRDDVVAVCHHAGFHEDWLTQDCDVEMIKMFGIGYAPAMVFDRAPIFENDKGAVTHTCPDKSIMMASLDNRMSEEPNFRIVLDTEFDETSRNLSLTADVERAGVTAGSNSDCRLTIYVVENNVKARRQSGADGDYWHQHVIRLYNSTWGDPLEWDMNHFLKSYEFELDSEWNVKEMEIVAVAGRYNPSDSNDCVVDNCVSIPLSSVSSVEDVACGECVSEEYYTLTGIRIRSPRDADGICVARLTYSDGRVKVKKILNGRQ